MQFFRRRVYADAAASTPLSQTARRELVRLLSLFGNAGGLHAEGAEAKRELESARARVAATLGAHPDEIIFTSGGTEGNNLGLRGTLLPILRERGEVSAITSAIEHPSVLEVFADMEPEGLNAIALPVDELGFVSPKMLGETINEETALVSIQFINSEVGTIQDIKEIAKVIRHARKVFASARALRAARPSPTLASGENFPPLPYLHVDASQAPLWVELNVEKLGVDLMTLDGQKIMGPKGVGILYVRRGVKISPVLLGGGQESGRRSGTENVPLIGSMAIALHEAQINLDSRVQKISALRDHLIQEIRKNIPSAVLNGPENEGRVANNCNVSIPGVLGELLVVGLSARGVAASTRSACASEDEEPSHVLRALGVSPELAKSTVRITLLPDASRRDVQEIVNALVHVVRRNRSVLQ
jgi:cysteine desulfurase